MFISPVTTSGAFAQPHEFQGTYVGARADCKSIGFHPFAPPFLAERFHVIGPIQPVSVGLAISGIHAHVFMVEEWKT